MTLPRVDLGSALMNPQAGGHRAREVDEPGANVVDEEAADLRIGPRDEVDHARRPAGLLDAAHEDAGDDLGGVGGLEHDRVARRDRTHRAADEDGEQEVPWRDHQADTDRLERGDVLLARDRHRRQWTFEGECRAGVVLDEVDRLGDVGVGFPVVLAGFERLPGAEF